MLRNLIFLTLLGNSLLAQDTSCATPTCYEMVSDCVGYRPPFYNLECDWGLSIRGEFLYFYANETNTLYAAEIQGVNREPGRENSIAMGPVSYKYLRSNWDPGFRIALGWNNSCNGWDLDLIWTSFKNGKRDFSSVPQFGDPRREGVLLNIGDFALLNPWINAIFLNTPLSNPTDNFQILFNSIDAKWQIDFNTTDLELGFRYCLSPCFNLRPFTGIRGARIKTNFDLESIRFFNENNFLIDANFKDFFKAKISGAGFYIGLEPNWNIWSFLGLYANFDAGLLWGRVEGTKQEIYTNLGFAPVNINETYKDAFYQMMPFFDLGVGLRFERNWCCNRFRTTLDAGWEHHQWFDQNHKIQDVDYFEIAVGANESDPRLSGFRGFIQTYGNIAFGGFVLRLKCDF